MFAGEGKQGAKLTAAKLGSFDLPEGAGTQRHWRGERDQSTIASAGFGNGIAQPGQADGRANGKGVQLRLLDPAVATNTGRQTRTTAARLRRKSRLSLSEPVLHRRGRKLQLKAKSFWKSCSGPTANCT